MFAHTFFRVFSSLLLGLSLFSLLWISPMAHAASSRITKTTPHFVFQYDTQWKPVASYLLKRAEKDFRELSKQLGYQFKGRFTVRISSPGKAYAAIQPHHWEPHANIAGLAYPHKKLMTLRVRTLDGMSGLHRTFRHELSHLLLFQAAHFKKMPLWFVEGVAMAQSNDFGLWDRYMMLSQAQLSKNIPELSRLKSRFKGSQQDIQIAYAISAEFIFFAQKKTPNFLAGMTAFLRKGLSFEKALEKQTGMPWWKLMDQWNYHLKDRYHWLPFLANTTTMWALFSIVFLLAFFRKRKERNERLEEMAEEDRIEDERRERMLDNIEIVGGMWEEMTPQERAELTSSRKFWA
jgi:hypothetical protein